MIKALLLMFLEVDTVVVLYADQMDDLHLHVVLAKA